VDNMLRALLGVGVLGKRHLTRTMRSHVVFVVLPVATPHVSVRMFVLCGMCPFLQVWLCLLGCMGVCLPAWVQAYVHVYYKSTRHSIAGFSDPKRCIAFMASSVGSWSLAADAGAPP